MSNSLANTWKQHFLDLPQNEDANRNAGAFSNATAGSASNDERLKDFLEDPDAVTMAIAPITGKVKFLHSFKNLGGTRSRPADKIIALDGRGPTAQPVLIHKDVLLKTVQIEIPPLATLKTVANTTEVMAAAPAAENPGELNQSIAMILPPFLFSVLLEL
uniref:Uncharacterized protein n=1 Tax=Odontella aurita TaxID=265563 RepID=A0A7S4IZS4_9STRA|mmetsp:Transcript_34077/g.101858  ORF Transcript_34077/g.101858 Transcript_34077/m.101858 type:complete len:160 (+) Transcript_34077:3914-4393(+)